MSIKENTEPTDGQVWRIDYGLNLWLRLNACETPECLSCAVVATSIVMMTGAVCCICDALIGNLTAKG